MSKLPKLMGKFKKTMSEQQQIMGKQLKTMSKLSENNFITAGNDRYTKNDFKTEQKVKMPELMSKWLNSYVQVAENNVNGKKRCLNKQKLCQSS